MNVKILKDAFMDVIALISLACILCAIIGLLIYGCIFYLEMRQVFGTLSLMAIGLWSLTKLDIKQ